MSHHSRSSSRYGSSSVSGYDEEEGTMQPSPPRSNKPKPQQLPAAVVSPDGSARSRSSIGSSSINNNKNRKTTTTTTTTTTTASLAGFLAKQKSPASKTTSRRTTTGSSIVSAATDAEEGASQVTISKLVATDLARRDHKDKLTAVAVSADAVVKQRPPPAQKAEKKQRTTNNAGPSVARAPLNRKLLLAAPAPSSAEATTTAAKTTTTKDESHNNNDSSSHNNTTIEEQRNNGESFSSLGSLGSLNQKPAAAAAVAAATTTEDSFHSSFHSLNSNNSNSNHSRRSHHSHSHSNYSHSTGASNNNNSKPTPATTIRETTPPQQQQQQQGPATVTSKNKTTKTALTTPTTNADNAILMDQQIKRRAARGAAGPAVAREPVSRGALGGSAPATSTANNGKNSNKADEELAQVKRRAMGGGPAVAVAARRAPPPSQAVASASNNNKNNTNMISDAEAKRRARGGPAVAMVARPAAARISITPQQQQQPPETLAAAAPNPSAAAATNNIIKSKNSDADLAEAKRQARGSGGPAVAMVARPARTMLPQQQETVAAPSSPTGKNSISDSAMAEAKRLARRGPAVAMVSRPAPARAGTQQRQEREETVGTETPSSSNNNKSSTSSMSNLETLEEIKRRERENRGPALAAVARNPRSAAAAATTNRDGSTSPKKSSSSNLNDIEELKRRERERSGGPAVARARVAPTSPSTETNSNLNSIEEIKRREKERSSGPALAQARAAPPSPKTNSNSNLNNIEEIKRREKERSSGPAVAQARAAAPPSPKTNSNNSSSNIHKKSSNLDDIEEIKRREVESRTSTMVARRNPPSPTRYAAAAAAPAAVDNQDYDSHSCSSDDSAYALAMARTSMAKETAKLRAQESGPSLAPATSGIFPGGFGFVDQTDKEKMAASGTTPGPSVSRAVSRDMRTNSFEEEMVTTFPDEEIGGEIVYESDDNHFELEAEAGVPVVVPGAFAVQGVDNAQDTDSDYSSLDEHGPETAEEDQMTENGGGVLDAVAGPGATSALDAEVYEEVVVEGAMLTETDEDELDPKAIRRLRMIQATIVGFCMAAIGLIVGSVLGFRDGGDSKPTVEGWIQVGPDIYGPIEEPQTLFGSSLACSADGTRLAIAAPGADVGTSLNVGEILIMEEVKNTNGTQWDVLYKIIGTGPSAEAQIALAMSEDSSWLAVGSPRLLGGSQVQLYGFSEETGGWEASVPPLVASDNDNSDGAWFGYSVDLSADGGVLAVGAPLTDGPNGAASGAVYLYQRDNEGGNDAVWVPMGEPLVGLASSEFFGWSVALRASDGYRLAVGAPVSKDTMGLVRVFHWTGSEWITIAQELTNDVPLNRFGESVSLSDDGLILAVGSRGSSFETGQTQIFREAPDGSWLTDAFSILLGSEAGEGFGTSIELSGDGTTLAVGAPQNKYFGEGSGLIQVFQFDSIFGVWEQQGSGLGSEILSEYGAVVALSKDGTRVAGGAPSTAYVGSISRAGSALVFDREAEEAPEA